MLIFFFCKGRQVALARKVALKDKRSTQYVLVINRTKPASKLTTDMRRRDEIMGWVSGERAWEPEGGDEAGEWTLGKAGDG